MRRELVKIKMPQKTHVARVAILLHLKMTKRSIINNGLISIQVSLTLSLPAYHCRQWKYWRINVKNKLINTMNLVHPRSICRVNYILLFDLCRSHFVIHFKFQTQTFFKTNSLREIIELQCLESVSLKIQFSDGLAESIVSFNSKFWPTFYFYPIIFTAGSIDATNQKVLISYISAFVHEI